MPLIVWDLKRGIPIWLFMLIAGGFLCFIFFDNGGVAVYTRADATLGSQIVPVLLGLLVLLLIYAVISVRRLAIVVLENDHFIFQNAITTTAIPAGGNTLAIFLDSKDRPAQAIVMSPDSKLLYRMTFRVMAFACSPADVPPEYNLKVIPPGPAGVF